MTPEQIEIIQEALRLSEQLLSDTVAEAAYNYHDLRDARAAISRAIVLADKLEAAL